MGRAFHKPGRAAEESSVAKPSPCIRQVGHIKADETTASMDA